MHCLGKRERKIDPIGLIVSGQIVLQPGILESQNAMNAVDGATIERPRARKTNGPASRRWSGLPDRSPKGGFRLFNPVRSSLPKPEPLSRQPISGTISWRGATSCRSANSRPMICAALWRPCLRRWALRSISSPRHESGGRETRTLVRHYVRTDLVERKKTVLEAWHRRLREIIDGQTARVECHAA
jgi:hypothetical protein